MAGDFSRLAPLFEASLQSSEPQIVAWHQAGLFKDEPEVLNEAFTCACFNGNCEVIEYHLSRGVHPSGGAKPSTFSFAIKLPLRRVTHMAAQFWAAPSGRPFTSPNLSTPRSLRLYSARALVCAKRNTRQASTGSTGY
jgi:hypothetical protein